MTTSRTTATALVGLPERGDLIVKPLQAASIAFNPAVTTVVVISTETDRWRAPMVTTDPTASWVAEGQEITLSDMTTAEAEVVPAKVAGLVAVTRELANDSNPDAADQVGVSLARDIARRVDEAFVGNLAAPAPKGLASLTTVQTIAAGANWSSLDPFIDASALMYAAGAHPTAYLTGTTELTALSKVRKSSGSNEPLLQPDPTAPSARMLGGVPLIVTPALPAGVVWAVDASRIFTILREDVEVVADGSVYFSSDRIAVKGVARVGFGFIDPTSLVKITRGA